MHDSWKKVYSSPRCLLPLHNLKLSFLHAFVDSSGAYKYARSSSSFSLFLLPLCLSPSEAKRKPAVT